MNYQEQYPVHFLHVGKTGGTALKAALTDHLETPHHLIKLHKHNFQLHEVPVGEKFFFFLRDPIQRFVSSFYSRQRRGAPRYNYPWSPGEKISFETFSTPNDLAESLNSNNPTIKKLAFFAMSQISHVKNSYYDWFKDDAYLHSRIEDLLMIGFQENMTDDFERLKRLLQLPITLELPTNTIVAHKSPTDDNRHLSERADTNLRAWYVKDIAFHEFCQQINKLLILANRM